VCSPGSWRTRRVVRFRRGLDAQGDQRYEQYVLAITHPDEIRQDTRWGYPEMFEDLPQFWGDGVLRCVADGQARGFAVYLVR